MFVPFLSSSFFGVRSLLSSSLLAFSMMASLDELVLRPAQDMVSEGIKYMLRHDHDAASTSGRGSAPQPSDAFTFSDRLLLATAGGLVFKFLRAACAVCASFVTRATSRHPTSSWSLPWERSVFDWTMWATGVCVALFAQHLVASLISYAAGPSVGACTTLERCSKSRVELRVPPSTLMSKRASKLAAEYMAAIPPSSTAVVVVNAAA